MAIYKITYSDKYKRANLHNYGCNFNCTWCSYKLQEKKKPYQFLNVQEIKKVLSRLDIDKVHFVGEEPTTYPMLSEICDFAKNELDIFTKIGHSNGYNMPPENIDAMLVSIKSLSEDFYLKYTGKSNASVLENFKLSYKRGVKMDASSVFIPGLIEYAEIDEISKFIANLDPKIPYHITGYIPVPGAPWHPPTQDEIKEAKLVAEQYLDEVSTSWFSSVADYFRMTKVDPKYQSIPVA
jgi:pyruvate formate lyase activating enzyme